MKASIEAWQVRDCDFRKETGREPINHVKLYFFWECKQPSECLHVPENMEDSEKIKAGVFSNKWSRNKWSVRLFHNLANLGSKPWNTNVNFYWSFCFTDRLLLWLLRVQIINTTCPWNIQLTFSRSSLHEVYGRYTFLQGKDRQAFESFSLLSRSHFCFVLFVSSFSLMDSWNLTNKNVICVWSQWIKTY